MDPSGARLSAPPLTTSEGLSEARTRPKGERRSPLEGASMGVVRERSDRLGYDERQRRVAPYTLLRKGERLRRAKGNRRPLRGDSQRQSHPSRGAHPSSGPEGPSSGFRPITASIPRWICWVMDERSEASS